MKKLRIILSVFAIALAVSATFAMRSTSSMIGYRYIPATPTAPAQCKEETVDCVVSAANNCTLGLDVIKRFNDQTECGPALKRTTP